MLWSDFSASFWVFVFFFVLFADLWIKPIEFIKRKVAPHFQHYYIAQRLNWWPAQYLRQVHGEDGWHPVAEEERGVRVQRVPVPATVFLEDPLQTELDAHRKPDLHNSCPARQHTEHFEPAISFLNLLRKKIKIRSLLLPHRYGINGEAVPEEDGSRWRVCCSKPVQARFLLAFSIISVILWTGGVVDEDACTKQLNSRVNLQEQ